jgi:HEAT repeat protein
MMRARAFLVAILALGACAGPKAAETREKLEERDLPGALASYRAWRAQKKQDDHKALRALALQTLYQALRSDAPEVRRAAIEAAWQLDEAELAEPVARLLDDDDDAVRATAAAALIKSHPDAGRVLAETLGSPEADARVIAVRALGDRVGKRAHDDIARALGDKDGRVRAAACQALEHAFRDDDTARLVELAGKDPDGQVRAAALRALTHERPAAAAAPARALLTDGYLGARLAAVEALSSKAIDATADLRQLAAGTDSFVALRAAAALARRGERDLAAKALDAAIASPEWTVRAAAANATPMIVPAADAAPRLDKLATDADAGVRLAAARAWITLGKLDKATPVLVAALDSSDDGTRLEAAIDLQRIRDTHGAPALDALMGSHDANVRKGAAAALRDGGAVGDALLALLADPQPEVRVAAAWTILALSA